MILLTGVRGVVGQPLFKRLVKEGIANKTVSRSSSATIQWDMSQAPAKIAIDEMVGIDNMIHCAPIWLLPEHLACLKQAGLKRLIVFSSTSVVAKQKSTDKQEKYLVKQLAEAEDKVKKFCISHAIALTIFRPSMIYGYARDQNISKVAAFIRRFGIVILAGQASGLRQPVHADDLVDAAITVLDNENCYGKTYHLAGAEQLSYRDMVKRIFSGLGKHPKIISLPLGLFRLVLRIASKVSHFSYTAEMANRMHEDLIYDYQAASDDFAYYPQAFLLNPSRDLP